MYEEYIKVIKERLSERRFNHSICVSVEARRLAEKYGADADKAELCGILHDITKESSAQEHFEIAEKYGVKFSDLELSAEKLWHAKTGAAYARYILNIDDDEIINAIKYHTTGKEDMTLLQEIVFLADFTSADRDYEDVDVMRALVGASKEMALSYALKYTINDLLHKDKAIHPDTFAAYNSAKMKRGK